MITGCFGFVGAHLVRRLRETDPGAVIIGVGRQAPPAGFPAVQVTRCLDLLDHERLATLVTQEQPDRLVHLASNSSVAASWQDPLASFTNNTTIFLGVLESIRRHSPATRILSVGSSEQYGRVAAADLPLVERAQQHPLSPYAVSRVANEHLGNLYVRGFGLHVVGTRSFNHVGTGQSAQFVVSAIGKQFAELTAGTRDVITAGVTSVVRDFLDVRDVVNAYLALLELDQPGDVYNICSGRGVSITEVIAMFGAIANVTPTIETNPALVRPVENEIVVGSHAKLTAAVGWQPTIALEDSLRTVYEYWRERV